MSKYPELDDYIKKAKSAGKTDIEIKDEMINAGYNQDDIDSVFPKTNSQFEPIASQPDVPPQDFEPQPGYQANSVSQNPNPVLENNLAQQTTQQTTESAPPLTPTPNPSSNENNTQPQTNISFYNNPQKQDSNLNQPPTPQASYSQPLSQQINNTPLNNVPQNNATQNNIKKSKTGPIVIITIILVLIIGGAFYLWNSGILSAAPYNQSNLFSGLAYRMSTIESYSYSFNASFVGQPRDPEAVPFKRQNSNENFYSLLDEALNFVPKDINVSIGSNFRSNTENESYNFALDINAEGDLGDIIYRIDLNTILKDDNLYVRLNNFPSLLLMFFPIPKEEWILIDYNTFVTDMFFSDFSDVNDNDEELIKFYTEIIKLADRHRLLNIVNNPTRDNVNNKTVYRYELEINPENLIPFIDDLIDKVESMDLEFSSELSAELRSTRGNISNSELIDTLNYYNSNTKNLLWVDSNGYLVKFESQMRLVPGSQLLSDRQFLLMWSLILNDVNQTVRIDAPNNYRSLEELMEEIYSEPNLMFMGDPQNNAEIATVKSWLANSRAQAELYYDSQTPGSYEGVCLSENGIANSVMSAGQTVSDNNPFCNDNATSWVAAVNTRYGSVCVDSRGSLLEYDFSHGLGIDDFSCPLL